MSLFLNAGSRWETLETSGVARLLLQSFLRKKGVSEKLNRLGGRVELTCEREMIGVNLNVLNQDVEKAV